MWVISQNLENNVWEFLLCTSPFFRGKNKDKKIEKLFSFQVFRYNFLASFSIQQPKTMKKGYLWTTL